jgi:hypothetical protein
LNPLLVGEGPTWSLAEAGVAFPGLIAYLLYGGLTGIGFVGLVTQSLRLFPETEPAAEIRPAKRVLILGGGYGGMRAAQRLEQLYARAPDLEITLVSQSNFLLFTPLLAEVAASALAAQHISTPLRAVCPRAHFLHATVEAIDPDMQTVQVRATLPANSTNLPATPKPPRGGGGLLTLSEISSKPSYSKVPGYVKTYLLRYYCRLFVLVFSRRDRSYHRYIRLQLIARLRNRLYFYDQPG